MDEPGRVPAAVTPRATSLGPTKGGPPAKTQLEGVFHAKQVAHTCFLGLRLFPRGRWSNRENRRPKKQVCATRLSQRRVWVTSLVCMEGKPCGPLGRG